MGSRQHHKIFEQTDLVGFLSPTLEMPGVWSIYNRERKKVAMVYPDGAAFNMMFYGKHGSNTTEYFNAPTFDAAVKRAFRLGYAPRFEPPLALGADGVPALGDETPAKVTAALAADLEGVDGYLDALVSGVEGQRAKMHALDTLISKARALRTKLASG